MQPAGSIFESTKPLLPKIDGLPLSSRIEQLAGGNMPLNINAGYSAQALRLP